MSAKLELQLDRARWFLLSNQPFYGALTMSLNDSFSDFIPTACTDGKRIIWGRSFLEKLNDEETRYVLLHETLHCAHQHLWRFPFGGPEHERANIACDHVINLMLNTIPEIKMPVDGLADSQYKGLSEEEVFHRLPKNAGRGGKQDVCGTYSEPDESKEGKENPGSKGKGAQGGGDGKDAMAPGIPDPTLKEKWTQRVIQAAQNAQAQQRGTLPADIERLLKQQLRNELDWKRETADFVKEVISTRNDWSRSARRMATQPCIYPRKRQDLTGMIIAIRDVSGSITDEIASEFSGLISACLADTGCSALILDVDTEIHAEYRVEAGGECPLIAHGGGGSSMLAGFFRADQLVEQGERVAGVICLTDLYVEQPKTTDHPTLWLCTNDQIAETGRTIKISV